MSAKERNHLRRKRKRLHQIATEIVAGEYPKAGGNVMGGARRAVTLELLEHVGTNDHPALFMDLAAAARELNAYNDNLAVAIIR